MLHEEVHSGVIRLGGSTHEVLARLEELRDDACRSFVQRGKGLDIDSFREGIRFVLEEPRQGIYVFVRGGRPRLIVSIANTNFQNTFKAIKFRVGHEDISYDEFKARNRKLCNDWLPPNEWWASHGILCTTPSDRRFGWGTGMLAEIKAVLEAACARRDLDDVECIVNRRDVPMVRRDGQHCYHFAGATKPRYRPRLPVLSLYQGDAWHDLQLIEPNEPTELRQITIPWACRRPWALFRGSCTGSGTSRRNNVRIDLAFEGQLHDWRLDNKNLTEPLVDVALTGYSKRAKFVERGIVEFDDPRRLPRLEKRVEMSEWSRWKYLIYVEGFSAALRMTPMLSSGSVIIYVKGYSDADRLWYFDRLVPCDWHQTYWQQKLCPPEANVLVIESAEMLRYTIPFLKRNDDIARCLGQNARKLYDEICRSRLDFMGKVLATCREKWAAKGGM